MRGPRRFYLNRRGKTLRAGFGQIRVALQTRGIAVMRATQIRAVACVGKIKPIKKMPPPLLIYQHPDKEQQAISIQICLDCAKLYGHFVTCQGYYELFRKNLVTLQTGKGLLQIG